MSKKSHQDDLVDIIKLHGFCNASLQNYGAYIYLRHVLKSGNVSLNLVAAKSKLAPLKPTRIPRLELLGNLLITR